MMLRIPAAFVLGLVMYMIEVALTVYDGALSLIVQSIVGSIATLLAIAVLMLVGSPLLVRSIWYRWMPLGWWPLTLTVVGVVMFAASWHPAVKGTTFDPEFQANVVSPNPTLGIGGWLIAMAGLLFCPAIGLRGDRRWA